jgi:DMSO reductase anchor subunit
MLAKYILLLLAVVFLFGSVVRGTRTPQGRTWLLIAAIFGIVSGWLLARG